jgi:hypothetical protein
MTVHTHSVRLIEGLRKPVEFVTPSYGSIRIKFKGYQTGEVPIENTKDTDIELGILNLPDLDKIINHLSAIKNTWQACILKDIKDRASELT